MFRQTEARWRPSGSRLRLQMSYTGGSAFARLGFDHLLAPLSAEGWGEGADIIPVRFIDLSTYRRLSDVIDEVMRTVGMSTRIRFITRPRDALSILVAHFMPSFCLSLTEPVELLAVRVQAIVTSRPNLLDVLEMLRPICDHRLLSRRQRVVLEELKKNSSVAEIAATLNLAEKSVYAHASAIRMAFGFHCEQKFREYLYFA